MAKKFNKTVMGLTSRDAKTLTDIVKRANEEQLRHIVLYCIGEQSARKEQEKKCILKQAR